MANLTTEQLDYLEGLYDSRTSHGDWKAYSETVHLNTWDHPTEPIFKDSEYEGLDVVDIDAEYTCVAALGYDSDMAFIAEANNNFKALLDMARLGMNHLANLESRYESMLYDAFIYHSQGEYAGIQHLHTVADLSIELNKPNEWVDEVYRVMTEVHDGMVSPDIEDHQEALDDAWSGGFPSTIAEAIEQSMNLK